MWQHYIENIRSSSTASAEDAKKDRRPRLKVLPQTCRKGLSHIVTNMSNLQEGPRTNRYHYVTPAGVLFFRGTSGSGVIIMAHLLEGRERHGAQAAECSARARPHTHIPAPLRRIRCHQPVHLDPPSIQHRTAPRTLFLHRRHPRWTSRALLIQNKNGILNHIRRPTLTWVVLRLAPEARHKRRHLHM